MSKKYSLKKASRHTRSKRTESSSRRDHPYGLYFIDEIMMFQEESPRRHRDERNESASWNEWNDDWLFMGAGGHESPRKHRHESPRKHKRKKKESSSSSSSSYANPHHEHEHGHEHRHGHESRHAHEPVHESVYHRTETEWEELPQSFDELARLDYYRATRRRKKKKVRKKHR